MGNEQSSQIDSAEESRNVNGIKTRTKSEDIEQLVEEKNNGGGERGFGPEGTKLKNGSRPRTRKKKPKKCKSVQAYVEVLDQAEDVASLLPTPPTQALQSQPWSFTAINCRLKNDVKLEIESTTAENEKSKPKEKREAEERGQLSDPQENLTVKLEDQVSLPNDHIRRKTRGRPRNKQVQLEGASRTLVPEIKDVTHSRDAISDVVEDIKPETTTIGVIKKKKSPLPPSEAHEGQVLDVDDADVQVNENLRLAASGEQNSDTNASKKAKSKKSRRSFSQIDLEPAMQSNPALEEPEPAQLLTPEATHNQPTPKPNLFETAIADSVQLNADVHSPDPQPDSFQSGTRNLVTVPSSDPHSDSASEPDTKRKRKNRKSLEASSSSALKKRKRSRNEADMDLTDEEMFNVVMETSSDLAFGIVPEDQNTYEFSSPPPPFATYDGFMDNFRRMQDPTETQLHAPAINDSHSAPPEQVQSPYVAYHRRLETENGQNVPSLHGDYELEFPRPLTPIRSRSSRSQYRLVDSWDLVGNDAYVDEFDAPSIGIYKNVNGVFHRKESLSGFGQENGTFWESDNIFGNEEVQEPFSRSKKKRRARTENDSIFDMKVVEEQPSRKKRSSLQSKAPVKSTPKNPQTPKTTGKSSLSSKPSTKPAPRAVATTRKRQACTGLKNGKFEKEEIDIIAEVMVKYREAHDDISQVELNHMIQDNAFVAQPLWNQLCDALPDRSRQAVIKICRRRYHNYDSRGTWTKEDDEQLKDAYQIYSNKWKKIAELLNRHPEDVRDRWRNYLICGDKQRKDVWTEDEAESLRLAVFECLEAIREIREQRPHISDGPQKSDMDLIDWQMVSKKLNYTRSRLQCLSKWKNMRGREDSENGEANDLELDPKSWRSVQASRYYPGMDSNDHLHLLYAIRHSQAGREGKIPFPNLGDDDFRRKWNCAVRKLAWKKMRATIPGNMDMKLQDIVTLLIDHLTDDSDYLAQHITYNRDEPPASRRRTPRKPKVPKLHHSEEIIDRDEQVERQNEISYDASLYDTGSVIKQLYNEDDEDLLYTNSHNSEALRISESLILPQLNSTKDMITTGSPMPRKRAKVSQKRKNIYEAISSSLNDSRNEDIPARRPARKHSVEL